MYGTLDSTLTKLRLLRYVSSAKLVGSYSKGKRRPKDIDILIRLKIKEATLWCNRTKIGRTIKNIVRQAPTALPFDVFIITSDRKKWRLRPWQDISTKKTTYEWE